MLDKKEREKLKNYPKWIQSYIKSLEDKVKAQETLINILTEQDYTEEPEVTIISNIGNKEFNFSHVFNIKIHFGVMKYIEISKNGDLGITIRSVDRISIEPNASNSITVRLENL